MIAPIRRWVTVITCLSFVTAAGSENLGRVTVPGGTPVIVKLVNAISSGTQHKGDNVPMEVASDVFVNGKLVIAAGTAVQTTVDDVAKKFFAGIGGYLKLSVQNVKSTGGTLIPIKFEKSSSGESNIWGAILGVVCCCIFLLIPGKDVEIPAGTLYNAVVLGPTDVLAARASSPVPTSKP